MKLGRAIDSFIIKQRELLFLVARNLTFVFLIAMILEHTKILKVGEHLNLNWLCFIIFAIDALALVYYLKSGEKGKTERLMVFIKYIFLILLIIITINIHYKLNWLIDYMTKWRDWQLGALHEENYSGTFDEEMEKYGRIIQALEDLNVAKDILENLRN